MSNKQELQQLRTAYQAKLLNNIEVTINTREVDDIFDKLEELASNLREAYRDNIGDLSQLESWVDSMQRRLMCVSYILPYYNVTVDTFGEHAKPGDVGQIRTNQHIEEVTDENRATDSSIPYYLQNHRAHQESHLVIPGNECKLKIGLRGRQVPSVRYVANRVLRVLGTYTPCDEIIVYNQFYNRATVTLDELLSYGNIVSLDYYTKRVVAFMPKYEADQDTQVRAFYLNADGSIVLSNVGMFSGGEYTVIMSKTSDGYHNASSLDMSSYVSVDKADVRVAPDKLMREVTPSDISDMRYSTNKVSMRIGYNNTKVLYHAYRADNVLKALKTRNNRVVCHLSSYVSKRVVKLPTNFELVVYSHDTTHMLGILHDGYFHPFYISSYDVVHLSRTAYRYLGDRYSKGEVAKLIH